MSLHSRHRRRTGAGDRHDATGQTEYVDVTPCRVLDTRLTGAGTLQPNVARDFLAKGADLSAQGGSASGCGVPANAKSIFINFVTVTSSGAGHIKAWQHGGGEPSASVMNYGAVAGLAALANGIAIPICDEEQSSCPYDFTVKAAAASTHLVVDIVGYFVPAGIAGTTVATCNVVPNSSVTCQLVCPDRVVAQVISPHPNVCTVTSDTGSCTSPLPCVPGGVGCTNHARCCVCRP